MSDRDVAVLSVACRSTRPSPRSWTSCEINCWRRRRRSRNWRQSATTHGWVETAQFRVQMGEFRREVQAEIRQCSDVELRKRIKTEFWLLKAAVCIDEVQTEMWQVHRITSDPVTHLIGGYEDVYFYTYTSQLIYVLWHEIKYKHTCDTHLHIYSSITDHVFLLNTFLYSFTFLPVCHPSTTCPVIFLPVQTSGFTHPNDVSLHIELYKFRLIV